MLQRFWKPSSPTPQVRGPEPSAAPAATADEQFHKAFFDENFYLATYADVADSPLSPFDHFLRQGRALGRVPSEGWTQVAHAVEMRSAVSDTPMTDIVSKFPPARRKVLKNAAPWERVRQMVHPALYAAQQPEAEGMSTDDVFDHYLAHGLHAGLRPSGLFHPGWYARQLEIRNHRPVRKGTDPFLHWITVGYHRRIIPTPLFDEDYYLARHPDLVHWKHWLFTHYVTRGAFEPNRQPSAVVPNLKRGAANAPGDAPPLVEQMIRRAPSTPPSDLSQSSNLEDTAIQLREKLDRLAAPPMRELVEKAAEIEPLILRPYGPRAVNAPPFSHGYLHLRDQAEELRRALKKPHYDTVVLTPHCRMAGSARVAGALTGALVELDRSSDVLVLTTDLSDFERPEWFPDEADVLDLSGYAATLTPDERLRLLLDVVRGLTPARVINVNSRLGWDLFADYGKQLATWTELGAYLFTWDLDDKGNKGGYPIAYFQGCFPSLSWVLTDSAALRNELVERYSMSTALQNKIKVAYTPVPVEQIDHSTVMRQRRTEGRLLRAFWAGRFDRQKRFDVVVEIARRMPELEVWAWGKPVLGGLDLDFEALPGNVRLQGEYQHFDDLPVESCDFFLYTSEWDGLPTILLDAAARAIPVVASRVGGVADIVTEDTAFPVDEALDPDAYVAAIRRMCEWPAETTRRARNLKKAVQELCSVDAYLDVLGSLTGSGATADDPCGTRSPSVAVAESGRSR